MLDPTVTWYYVGGLGVLGWACLTVLALIKVPGKAAPWWAWGCALLGVLFCLGAGFYLAKVKQAQDIFGFLRDFKIVAFVLFIVVLVMVIKLVAGAVPDDYHPEALTTGIAIFCAFLPLLVGLVPGKVGDRLQEGTSNVSQTVVRQTSGWFG